MCSTVLLACLRLANLAAIFVDDIQDLPLIEVAPPRLHIHGPARRQSCCARGAVPLLLLPGLLGLVLGHVGHPIPGIRSQSCDEHIVVEALLHCVPEEGQRVDLCR